MPIHATHPDTGDIITASVTGASIVFSPRYGESYSFDQAGRLLGFFADGRSFQRTLDNRVVERGRPPATRRRELPPDQAASRIGHVFQALHALVDVIPRLALSGDDHDLLAEALARVLAFGPERLAADGAVFCALYKPVSILPPDQYLALVLQATEGCSWNRCTFCGFYRDRRFRIRGPEEFREHCARVSDFYAGGLSLRCGIFLADANALVIPQARLRAILATAQEFFALPEGPRPIYSFISAFDVGRKSPDEWAVLHTLGLKGAYIGLETGDDDLLAFLNKPGSSSDAVEAVQALHAGGISVGVIVMAGIGGETFGGSHVARTLDVLRAMELRPGDFVYLSSYVPMPGTEYPIRAAEQGILPLDDKAIQTQLHTLQAAARDIAPQAKVAPYYVDGFAL